MTFQSPSEPKYISPPVPAGLVQRAAIHASAEHEAPPVVHDVLRSPGRALDTASRSEFEPRFGHDFSRVRVHTDDRAAESAQAVNARAYTVGTDVVFGRGQYAPGGPMGHNLLAHELAHVVQQSNAGSGGHTSRTLAVNKPGDAHEREADAASRRVASGDPAGKSLTGAAPAIQRQTPTAGESEESEKKKEPGEVVVEGLKTVAEQTKDNNPKVKKVIVEPLKKHFKGEWGRLSTGEKVGTIGFGAATLGLTGGALLSDPSGRKQLEGVNLAAPFTLIPFMPLTTLKYALPSGDSPDKRLLKFETGFNADELLNLRSESRGLPKMTLGVNMQWGFDPASDRLSVLGGNATLGLVPGLSLSGGAYKDVLRPSPFFVGPGGETTQVKQTIPEFGKPEPVPDVRFMVTVDLTKFRPADLAKQLRNLF